jgi:translation initiation factor IF-1
MDERRPQPADVIEAEGVVMELLPRQLVRVELEGSHTVTAHLGEPLRRNFVRLLVGDRVRVVLMPADRTRGRIIGKL